jgi:hypothetical protein
MRYLLVNNKQRSEEIMQSVLITDGGPHSAEKWAEATASHIVSIAEHVAGEKRAQAVKLEAAVIDILEGHHTTVQAGERGKIAEVGHDRIAHDLDPEHHLVLDDVIADIVAAAKGTPWEADFAKPEMAENLRVLLVSHFSTSMHIERSLHADRNPAEHQSIQFKQRHNLGA